MKKLAIGAAALSFLGGCSLVEGPQGYAGLNFVEIESQVPEGESGVSKAKAVFGKDSENVAITLDRKNGTVSYSAGKNSGLAQVEARAKAQQAVTDIVGDPKLAGKVLDALAKMGL